MRYDPLALLLYLLCAIVVVWLILLVVGAL